MHIIDNRWEILPKAPRNFSIEPASWHDFMVALLQMTSVDFEFEIEYDLKSITTGKIWAGANSGDASAAVFISGTTLYIRNFSHYPESADYQVTASTGIHRVKITNAGNTIQIFYDGALVQTKTYSATPTKPTFSYVPLSNANCNINYVRFSCGDVMWAYPSISERMRLLTLNNAVRINGQWAIANSTVLARSIKTALDLRNNTTSKTFICSATIPPPIYPIAGSTGSFFFIRQGEFFTLGQRVFGFAAIYSGTGKLELKFLTGDTTLHGAADITDTIGIKTNYGAVVDMNAKTISLYTGETLRNQYSIPAGNWGPGGGTDYSNVLLFSSNGGYSGIYTAEDFLIANEAMTASQIAYASK